MNRMTKSMMAGLAAVSLVVVARPGIAAEEEGAGAGVDLSLDVASSYVFRGTTFNDGLAFQPGVEVTGLPITIGVWGNLDGGDYDNSLDSGQFSEIDLYASYALPVEFVGLSVGYTEYTYPSGGGAADRELNLSVEYEKGVTLGLSLNLGVDGGIDQSFYGEASVGYETDLADGVTLELGAAIAYLHPDAGEDGFSHVTASAGLGWGMFGIGVTYVGQIDDAVLPDYVPATAEADAVLGYDTEVIGSVGVSASF